LPFKESFIFKSEQTNGSALQWVGLLGDRQNIEIFVLEHLGRLLVEYRLNTRNSKRNAVEEGEI
jgi:hypothetical protein